MTDKTIAQLDDPPNPLDGSEYFVIWQGSNSYKLSLTALVTYIGGGGGGTAGQPIGMLLALTHAS